MIRLGGQRASQWVFGIPALAKRGSIGLAVDLGSGCNPRNVFDARRIIGIDVFEMPPFPVTERISYLQLDRMGRLPIEGSSVDALTAFDVLEHLPRQSSDSEKNPFIDTMNEIHRVLKPGGLFLAVTPCFPSPSAFQDPTHVNIITPDTHRYFSDDVWAKSLGYGFTGNFLTLFAGWYPWVGSWMAKSSLLSGEGSGENRDIFTRSRLSHLSRVINLIAITVIPRLRTHYLWCLEKTL